MRTFVVLAVLIAACSSAAAPDAAVEGDVVVVPDAVAEDRPQVQPDAQPTPDVVILPDAPRCLPPMTDCNGLCANMQTDLANCGSCGNACGADRYCSSGRCIARPVCARGRGDCDGNPGNGCETDLTRAESCGTCGTACMAGWFCADHGPTDGYLCRTTRP